MDESVRYQLELLGGVCLEEVERRGKGFEELEKRAREGERGRTRSFEHSK